MSQLQVRVREHTWATIDDDWRDAVADTGHADLIRAVLEQPMLDRPDTYDSVVLTLTTEGDAYGHEVVDWRLKP